MHDSASDRGAILPIILVVVLVLSLTVIGITNYVAADLRYARVTMNRADRLAAADAAMNYAVDQLKLRNASCLLGGTSRPLPGLSAPINGASTNVNCLRVGGGIGDIQAWAAVITGVGAGNSYLLSSQSGNSKEKILGGPVYMSRVTNASFAFGPDVKIKDGPLYYTDPGCGTPTATPVTAASLPTQLIFEPSLIYGPQCATQDWTYKTVGADPVAPDLSVSASLPLNPPSTLDGSCQVFSPGVYDTPDDLLPALGSNVYFKSGDYYFLNVQMIIKGSTVTAGFPDPSIVAALEVANSPCSNAIATDPNRVFPNLGTTFYFGGSTSLTIGAAGSLEIMPRPHGTSHENYVSIHALCSTTASATKDGCDQTGGPSGVPSTLTATGAQAIVYTQPGTNKQLVAHGLVYAPTGRLEFGNATNTAEQKIMGGLVVARLVLQSSASAQNFEIAVATSPIDVTVLLTATATKSGTTTIRAVVDYRPYEDNLDARLAISSWRVVDS